MINIIKNSFGRILQNDGPWGSYNGGDNNSGNKGKKPENNNGDFDEIFKKTQELLKDLFDSGGNKNGSKSNNGAKKPPVKSIFSIFILAIITLWLASGLYKVNPEENAVVLYFGKFYSIATPGLNYRLPAPIGKVIKKSVSTVNTEEFVSGVSNTNDNNNRKLFYKTSSRSPAGDSLMLTGDENIVDIDFQIQWQISDIKNFIFNIADQNITIKKAAESAMREIIAKTPIADALSDGKRKIEQETKDLLQQVLDNYGAGIRIVLVQMRRVDPPKQVIDSFRDVQTAKADKEREINQAEAYKNDIIPRARGNSAQLTQQAKAYEQEVIADAQGQAKRFLSVYYQYRQAKDVTRKRIYLETMEKIYKDMDKIIIDSSAAKSGVVPYLPVNELKKLNK